jgi:signal transduction histidine kinase
VRQAIEQLEHEIANLRAIITELRPAALDELGLASAISSLIERQREHSEPAIAADITLADPRPGQPRLTPELETTIYRIVQEALTNALKHAHATYVGVTVAEEDGEVVVEVRDDGAGFRPEVATRGYGLTGMRERVQLAGGRLEIDTGEHGTRVRAAVPARYATGHVAATAGTAGAKRAVP